MPQLRDKHLIYFGDHLYGDVLTLEQSFPECTAVWCTATLLPDVVVGEGGNAVAVAESRWRARAMKEKQVQWPTVESTKAILPLPLLLRAE